MFCTYTEGQWECRGGDDMDQVFGEACGKPIKPPERNMAGGGRLCCSGTLLRATRLYSFPAPLSWCSALFTVSGLVCAWFLWRLGPVCVVLVWVRFLRRWPSTSLKCPTSPPLTGARQVPANHNFRDLLFWCQSLCQSFNRCHFLSMRFRAEFG